MWPTHGSGIHASNNAPSEVSSVSMASSFRHANFAPQRMTPNAPSAIATPPKLTADATHEPKTRGSFGILVVGLGGDVGVTMLAGVFANRMKLQWRGTKGEQKTSNYNGCLTQLKEQQGGFGGIKGMADASMAAVGGWDVQPVKPGDALLEAQILDFDLVQQVQGDMNRVKLFRGLFDPRFMDRSKHRNATYILSEQEARNDSEALKCIRADIRYFKWRNGVVGHTTVVWSAGAEPNSDLVFRLRTATQLLESIELTESDRGGPLPPSLIYATAAVLEGCSFVNGNSQNTLVCPGLEELARQELGIYCLGSCFISGSSVTASVSAETLQAVGLAPQTNVVHNQATEFVEYSCEGFMGQSHSIVSLNKWNAPVFAAPLLVDVAVLVDFFSKRSWPYDQVAKSLSYLFQSAEGAARGVDPSFFRRIQELRDQIASASEETRSAPQRPAANGDGKRRVRIRSNNATAEWTIPNEAGIICAGLACVDMQLNHATGGDGGEGIETFEGEKSIGGGSVSMACKTLARLCQGGPLGDGYMEVSPPVVSCVLPLCVVGSDDSGEKLLSLLENCGSMCRNVDTSVTRKSRDRNPGLRTALSVLPIYRDGRRGCFFDAASNNTFTADQMVGLVQRAAASSDSWGDSYGAMLFGYPHLLPKMQGKSLAFLLLEARKILVNRGLIALDLNGVSGADLENNGNLWRSKDLKADPVIGAALEHVDLLHMNEDELVLLTGCQLLGSSEDEFAISKAVDLFLDCGVGVVAVTRGKKGSYVACNSGERFSRSPMLPSSWINCAVHMPASLLPPGTRLNTNGAGDSFTSGLLVAAMLRHTGLSVSTSSESARARSSDGHGKNQSEFGASAEASGTDSKLTPYKVYMRSNYVMLKQEFKGDKRAIFERCHEMWGNESPEVKLMYERVAQDEYGEATVPSEAATSFTELDGMASNMNHDSSDSRNASFPRRNHHLKNQALSLESAVQFAVRVAAHHIDLSTRDLDHLDIRELLDREMIFPSSQQEI